MAREKHKNKDINSYLDILFENGCDDTTISVGQLGFLALSFTRKANSANRKSIYLAFKRNIKLDKKYKTRTLALV